MVTPVLMVTIAHRRVATGLQWYIIQGTPRPPGRRRAVWWSDKPGAECRAPVVSPLCHDIVTRRGCHVWHCVMAMGCVSTHCACLAPILYTATLLIPLWCDQSWDSKWGSGVGGTSCPHIHTLPSLHPSIKHSTHSSLTTPTIECLLKVKSSFPTGRKTKYLLRIFQCVNNFRAGLHRSVGDPPAGCWLGRAPRDTELLIPAEQNIHMMEEIFVWTIAHTFICLTSHKLSEPEHI